MSPVTEDQKPTTSSNDDEELHQTMEDKEAWLRAHGVEIETPEERRKKAEDAARLQKLQAQASDGDSGDSSITRRFKYVRVPADEGKPFEQLEAIVAADAAGDILPDILQPRFKGGGTIDERMAREQAVRQLGAKGMDLSADALANAAGAGSTETFALVRPSDTNGHRGVYLYLDEVGMLKGLAPNPRAMALARECGFDNVQFFGDMYVGSVQADPGPLANVDFTVKELDSGSEWLKRAGVENYQYNQSMQQLQDAMREKGGLAMGGSGGDDGMPGGDSDGYSWSQTDDEVELSVDVPEGTKSRDVKVTFKPGALIVKVGLMETVSLPALYRKVRTDECTWTFEGGAKAKVIVTLAKVDEQVWHQLEAL